MKCIGEKCLDCVYYFIISLIGILALIVTPFLFQNNDDISFVTLLIPCLIGILVLLIIGIHSLYIIIFIPNEIVLFDEENKKVIVNVNKKKSYTLDLNQIKSINVERPDNYKKFWMILRIILIDDTIIEATHLSSDNKIVETLMEVRK